MTTLTANAAALARRSESVYAGASGNLDAIPWATGRPSQALINWLNAVAPSVLRCGARVCVAGCGLGDDAMAFLHRGYDVTAFDASPTAVEWAQQRFSGNRDSFVRADVFDAPARWRHRFDLVADINNLHALPAPAQEECLKHLADLMSPHGRLLVIDEATGHEHTGDASDHHPMTTDALVRHASLAGLVLCEPASVFEDDQSDPPTLRLRAMLERA